MPWEEKASHRCGLKARDAGTAVLAGSNKIAGGEYTKPQTGKRPRDLWSL